MKISATSLRFYPAVLLAFLMSAFCASASSPITLFNFESPVYISGPIGGQDGWLDVNYNVNNNASITTSSPISGAQSLLNDGTTSRSDAAHAFPLGTFANGTTVKYLQKVLVDSVTGQGSGLYIGKDPGTGHDPIWVRFLSGTIGVLTNGTGFPFQALGSYQVGKVYEVSITMDWDTLDCSVSVSNVTDSTFVGNLDVQMLNDVIPNPTTDAVGFVLAQYDGMALFDDIRIIPPAFPITGISTGPSNHVNVAWNAESSVGYAVDRATNFPPTWTVATNITAGVSVLSGMTVNINANVTDTQSGSQSYYRLRQTTAPTYLSTTRAGTEAADALHIPFANQTNIFTCTFDAWTSSNSVNQVIGLSAGTPHTQAASYSSLSCLIQLNIAGFFNVRDGTVYHNDNQLNYAADTKYSFRLVINVPAKTYSVFVTPDGGPEISLATDYTFRATAVNLDHWNLVVDHTSPAQSWITLGNFQIQ